ncbi:MAG: uracil-DNA glycosylase family protein [Caldilineaceae bacterium]|nr:uracil-DNA glycosylase family protein [Caldilineaceae bacterium]
MSDVRDLAGLVDEIRGCNVCSEHLPLGARPVFQFGAESKILIAGQAPGRKVHDSGVPFNDASGSRLREWLGLSESQFYDANMVAILPMGFCFPGTGKSGDLPPRPECAEIWRSRVLSQLKHLRLTLLLGQFAVSYHLPEASGSLTTLVRNWGEYGGDVFPLPHPSPRNNIWLKRNPWFEQEVIPVIKKRVAEVVRNGG